jgi:hypothetical protein
MRHPRLKPEYRDTWHHCFNRAVACSTDRPFDDADKEHFVGVLGRVAACYAVRIVAYQVMPSHSPPAGMCATGWMDSSSSERRG